MGRREIERNCENSSFTTDLEHPNRGENCHRHKQINTKSRKDKEVKVVNTVSKELSSKEFARTLSTFHPSGAFQKKEITCTSNQVEISFYSPLHGISDPGYIKKWKCEDMISEQTDSCNHSKSSPSVVGVKLNWKKDLKVRQISKFSRKTCNVEAEMTTTNFDFESKMKFQRELQAAQEELFHHEKNLMVLDGNQCHGGVALKAKELKRDDQEETAEGYNSSTHRPPTFMDQEEHIILLVPFHSKTGFDSDIEKRYTFPYHGKFSIGKKTFEHKFDLRLALTQQPQHFGLIFTFPEEPQAITVKSLITVYSVFPNTPKHSSLVTYKSHSTEDANQNKTGSKDSKRYLVKNVSKTVSESLTDGKLHNQKYCMEDRYKIDCDIAHPNRRYGEFSRNKFSLDEIERKHKTKQNLLKTMQAEAKEY